MSIATPTPTDISNVHQQFLAPLQAAHAQTTTRQCPVESDWDWLVKGVERVLATGRSGRDFLQTFQLPWAHPMGVGTYFETLASQRRLAMVAECSAHLRGLVDKARPSPLAAFAELERFAVYAGDGHYLAAATHDVRHGATAWPTGHFFALNLKSQSLFPLALGTPGAGKMENDLRALKRQSVAQLRQGGRQGDQGAVDLG